MRTAAPLLRGYAGHVDKVRAAEYGTPALDRDGIPIVDYTIFGGTESGVHNPITTAQYALGLYEEYLADGDDAVREAFLSQADWLVSMQSDDGGFYYEFDLPSRSLKAPWLSAMAQGEGMSSSSVRTTRRTMPATWRRPRLRSARFLCRSRKAGCSTRTRLASGSRSTPRILRLTS